MVINPLKFIFLFFCLFSFLLSEDLKDNLHLDGEGTKTFEIKIDNVKKSYIHIKVESETEKNQIVMVCSDQDCEKRLQMGIQQNGLINLFIKKNQVKNSFYILVQCAEEDENCKYNLDLIEEITCQLDIDEQASYYSYENSQDMSFSFKSYNSLDADKIIIWVKGQTIQESSLKIGSEEIKGNNFGYGNIFYIDYVISNTYDLKVVSSKQDYITVGSLHVKNQISKTLQPNDLEIMGILNKEEEKICFDLKTFEEDKSSLAHIEGIIFTKRAQVYFTNLENEGSQNYYEIENGQILQHIDLTDYNEKKYFCIKASEKDKEDNIIFSIQLVSTDFVNYSHFIYAPQLPGVIYRHFLPKGKIGIFRSMTPTIDATDINFNMKAIKGFPDMKIDESNDFPITNYKEPSRIASFKNPHNSNRITVYYIDLEQEKNKYELFNKRQDLLVVECLTGSNSAEEKSPFCEFETLIFSNKDRVNLIEKDSLSQFLMEGEEDLYTLDISKEEKIEKVYLDLIVFSGDVTFDIESDEIPPEDAHKYFISNKIFYSIHINSSIKKINSRVTAEKNSFYMIQYQIARSEEEDESKNLYKIDSGINYIQSIFVGDNSDYMKYIDFENLKYETLSPFFVNFYSENCDFVISKKMTKMVDGKEIEDYDYLDMEGNYAQHIIDENDPLFDLDNYRFKIEITGTDVSEYNNKLCMFYITGVELSNTNNETERTISISEGVPQYYIFKDKYTSLKYSYHISDKSKSIIINLNLIDKALYTVSVKHNYIDIIEPRKVYRNQQIIIPSSILDDEDPSKKICKEEDVVCTIDIFVDLNREGDSSDKKFELIVNQINGAPTYLQKNVVKQDILISSERKYYYIDIGKGETGDITIDYIRGCGHIYGQVVNKKLDEKTEDAEWRGIFNFPKSKTEEEGLPYKTYLKKLEIKEEHTKDCGEGCFVLITVESSLYQGEEAEEKEEKLTPYRITITPRVFPSGVSYLPKVTIPLNQFIIGNVYESGEEIRTFYKVFIPYDSDFIIFDWQADMCTLLINIGDERPDFNSKIDFTFKPGQDNIIKLKREDIIKISGTNSLKNLTLTIGIWSDKMDTLDSSIFAFKIFVPKKNDGTYTQNILETIHIRSDQKVQCKPYTEDYEHYSCIFAVVFDDCDVGKNIVVYPRAQKEYVQVKFKGYIVDAEKVERNDLKFIDDQFKSVNYPDFSSDNIKRYIYHKVAEKNQSILFEVTVDESVDIEILSSTYEYTKDTILIPNPSTPQVFAIGEEKIQFNFETSKDLLINIVSISGSGSFYWATGKNDDIRYYLNDFEDRLTLTSGTEDNIDKYANLVVQSSTFTEPDLDKSGFVFYMTFYPRNSNYNIDQVKIGRSTEFNYRQVKFPLYYYTKLNTDEVVISLTFYNYYMKREERFPYDKQTYAIYSKIITEEQALDARLNGRFPAKTDPVDRGEFDGAFATLVLDNDKIQKYNIKENPYLIFWVEFNDSKTSELFNGISVEVTLLESSFFAPQSVYINSKLSEVESDEDLLFAYKLKAEKEKKFMRIEFSANSNYVKWGVSLNKNYNSNTGIIEPEEKEENGRSFLTFEVPQEIFTTYENTLYLVVHWDDGKIKKGLGSYIFKYMNGISRESFFTFPQEENKIDYSIIKHGQLINYEISFSPVEQYDVNYYVKAVYKNSLISGEKKDTIAISNTLGRYLQVDNPYFEGGNEKVNFTLENISEEVAYIKILAKVNLNQIKEFLLYKPIDVSKGGESHDDNYQDMPSSSDLIELAFDNDKEIKLNYNEAIKIQKYQIKFYNEIPKYIKVQVKRNDNSNQQIISLYPKQGEEGNRLQLAQSRFEDTVTMWVKKEQIENKLLYYTIECQNESNCGYKIDIFGYDMVQIDSYNFNYNYYVSENNKKMEFRINNNLDIEKVQGQIITLYATGGKDIKLDLANCLDDSCKQFSFSVGAAITKEIQKHYFFDLTIEAEEGDFISVGSKVTGKDGDPVKVDGDEIKNALKPNSYQFTGYLRKDILPKDCHLIPDDKDGYIAALFYNKNAEISFKDIHFNDIKNSQEIQNKGYYSYIHEHNNDKRYICIGLPPSDGYEIENLIYSLQLTQKTGENDLLNLYAPQITGNIYPRIIPKGSVVFFNAANLKDESKEISYNMISTEGLPRMYMLKCENYPLCDIEKTEGMKEISEINRISTWHITDIEKNTPISVKQNILVVKCEDLKDSGTDICQFQTSIYGDKDEIHLIEGQTFSQYIYENKKTQYIIDFSMEKTITKVHVDTLVISGDVSFTLHDNQNKEIDSHKYYLSNKIFYSINLNNDSNKNIRRIIVDIEAKVNSYYIIEYKLTRGEKGETTNDIYNGINYLIPISSRTNENNKLINIHSFNILKQKIQLVTFYSLNCDIKIAKIKKDGTEVAINSYGNYGQDVNRDTNVLDGIYSYNITATGQDISQYENNMCMLYVSGLEITDDAHSNLQKEILIGDGIPQRAFFNHGLKKLKFIYPNPKKEKNIAVYFKIISPGKFSYSISHNQYEYSEPKNIYQTQIEYLDKTLCDEEIEFCNIVVSVYLNEEDLDNVPTLEVTIKQINSKIPYYIPKGIVRQDFVPAKSTLYLFTTLGVNDQGFITINFARGSGIIYAKIVPINPEKGKEDPNPEWRQYNFPDKKEDSLYYEFYNKRLRFNTLDTNQEKCKNGCYLLISLQSSAKGKLDEEYRFHQFSITISLISSRDSRKVQVISIEPEEYVIGSLADNDKIIKKEMFEYYKIAIPYNADKVEFDWQSDSAILLINVGEKTNPDNQNYHFRFSSRSDSIFELSKKQIQERLIADSTIANTILTIGVYTEDYESSFGTPYSFRVHFSKNLNIYKVSSDQKTLCKPEKLENKNEYRCLYMITYGELDFIYDLMIYARSQSPSGSTYMYAKFIPKEIYDSFDVKGLEENIPNETNGYNTKKEQVDFIFLTLSEVGAHFFISVISDKPDIIEFITSFKTFDNELSPNPSSIQLFSINNGPSMKLKFITTQPLIIDIVSLYGSSKLYFEDDKNNDYKIRGRDDRISFAIPSDGKEAILMVEDLNYREDTYDDDQNLVLRDIDDEDEDEENKIKKPSVAFYLEYYLRSLELNLDELFFGKTVEFVYPKSDFPLYYYSKLNNLNTNVNTFFILHDLEPTNNNMNDIETQSSDIEFKGYVIKEKTIYLVKVNQNSKPSLDKPPIVGIYDPALQVGQLFLSLDSLKSFKIAEEDKPTIYLSLEKTNPKISFKKIRAEISAIQENNDIPVTEKLYQYGKIEQKSNINYYRLKVDNSTGDMRIQFSTNSKHIDFSINEEKENKKNMTFNNAEIKQERGKVFITFSKPKNLDYIYLNVFLKESTPKSKKIVNNYVFKYINAGSRNSFFEYIILNDDRKLSKEEKGNDETSITFNKIDSENVNITYSLKAVKNDDYKNELFDTIALTESNSIVVKTKNPTGEKITLSIKNNEYSYFQVIAQVINGPIIEYVSYEPLGDFSKAGQPYADDIDENSTDENEDGDNTALIAVIFISSILFIIVIILVVVIMIYNAKNKNLMEQVNKISFIKSGAKPKEDINLLLDNQNELE